MGSILLNGNDLTREQVIEIAINNAHVSTDVSKLANSRDYIVNKVQDLKIIYGVTTGFGSNADKMIEEKDTLQLQLNLLRSHACGVGNNFSTEIVRAIMAIRLNTLLKGHSGVQDSTVKQLEFLINNLIHPLIPEQGSVGASGDLCPLSHMALPLIGEGEVRFTDLDGSVKEMDTKDFLLTGKAKSIGFKPTTLSYKEGLALTNGTTVMAAAATIALYKAENLLKVGTLSSALIFESLGARKDAFAYKKIHQARNHTGQTQIADWLTILLDGSKLINISQKEILAHILDAYLIDDTEILDCLNELNAEKAHDRQQQIPDWVIDKLKGARQKEVATMLAFAKKKWKPQDSYSIRCLPQVFGASKTAIDHVISVIDNELNAACDNPLIFAEDDKVVSGGNFHGQPIALVMDYLKLAVAEMGNIMERQINKMVDSNTNDCMPSFLIQGTGLNNGLMIPQYAAASIVSENKVLVHPASADSIPTCENTEDHVSMGTIAARQAIQICENVERISAIALLTGFYSINMRLLQFASVGMESKAEAVLAPSTLELYHAIKVANKELQNPDFIKTDRFLSPEIKVIGKNLGIFGTIAEKYLQ